VMICVAINPLAYGCLSQFSIENFLSYGLEHENALHLFYHMNFVQNEDIPLCEIQPERYSF